MLLTKPRREYSVWTKCREFCMETDAFYDKHKGRAGFLVVLDPEMPGEPRRARAIYTPNQAYRKRMEYSVLG